MPLSQAEINDETLAAENDLDKITRVYLRIREARAERKKKWEAEDKGLVDQQDVLKMELLGHMLKHGVSQIGTKSGTVYQTEVMKCGADDWGVLHQHITESGNFELLEKRVSKTAVKKYMEDNDGRLPPGVSVFRELDVNIRRK